VTAQPGILLGVRVADCLPVLLVDPRHRVVAAVHGGWRGLLRRVVEKTVGVMRALFGTDPADVRAVLGPSIRVCCYAVGQEVVEAYAGAFVGAEKFFRRPPPGDSLRALHERYPLLFLSGDPPGRGRHAGPAAHLDLVRVAREQLRAAGVRRENVRVSEFCTACREDLFFSHRRDGARAGRMMAVIGIRAGRGRGSGARG
jgi:YfiH family protein